MVLVPLVEKGPRHRGLGRDRASLRLLGEGAPDTEAWVGMGFEVSVSSFGF